MFIHNLNPVFLHIGPLQIRYYGLVFALGFLIAYLIFRHIAKKGHIKNLTSQRSEELIIWLVIGIIVGARLGHFLFWDISTFWTNPLQVFRIWQGGLSFHGGLIAGFPTLYWFCKKYNIKFWQIADVLGILASFALFLGRIANFINAELVGHITNASWGVNFNNEQVNGELVYRHPSQLYESVKNLFNFVVLFSLYQKNLITKKFPDGFIAWLFVTLYGLLRFITNFWRYDTLYFGLSMGQWLSGIMFIVGCIMLFRLHKSTKPKKRKNKNKRK